MPMLGIKHEEPQEKNDFSKDVYYIYQQNMNTTSKKSKVAKKKIKDEVDLNSRTLSMCKERGISLFDIENQQTEMHTIAVMNDGMNLKHIRDDLLTPELCMIAVLENSEAFQYVRKDLQEPNLNDVCSCYDG